MKKLKSLQRAQKERDHYDYALDAEHANPFTQSEKELIMQYKQKNYYKVKQDWEARGYTEEQFYTDGAALLNSEKLTLESIDHCKKILNKQLNEVLK
jgi:hypothetical protein